MPLTVQAKNTDCIMARGDKFHTDSCVNSGHSKRCRVVAEEQEAQEILICASVVEQSSLSSRQIAAMLGISKEVVLKTMNKYGYKSYKLYVPESQKSSSDSDETTSSLSTLTRRSLSTDVASTSSCVQPIQSSRGISHGTSRSRGRSRGNRGRKLEHDKYTQGVESQHVQEIGSDGIIWKILDPNQTFAGDFNIDLNNCDSLASLALIDAVTAFNMVQVIDYPTRITPSTSTIIDLVFVSDRDSILNSAVVPADDISDHELILELTGDFNIDLNNCDSLASLALIDAVTAFNMVQVIDYPTRITPSTSTIIDLVFVSDRDSILNSAVVPADDISDHELIVCSLKTDVVNVDASWRTYRTFRYFNLDSFLTDLFAVLCYFMYDMPLANKYVIST
ncbi:hypothetical protein QE152_g39118 [Popillia japonica]|uniref:Endonuclease/exonuclease/phosphatase domain-containing protein n=1 Tax=Popillia japonica TaxID=7064 RepID=A0AAW1HV23_POPJA